MPVPGVARRTKSRGHEASEEVSSGVEDRFGCGSSGFVRLATTPSAASSAWSRTSAEDHWPQPSASAAGRPGDEGGRDLDGARPGVGAELEERPLRREPPVVVDGGEVEVLAERRVVEARDPQGPPPPLRLLPDAQANLVAQADHRVRILVRAGDRAARLTAVRVAVAGDNVDVAGRVEEHSVRLGPGPDGVQLPLPLKVVSWAGHHDPDAGAAVLLGEMIDAVLEATQVLPE